MVGEGDAPGGEEEDSTRVEARRTAVGLAVIGRLTHTAR